MPEDTPGGAAVPDGAVLLARAIVNSSVWRMRPNDRVVAITCLVLANHEEHEWDDGEKKILIRRGQFIRSWAHLAKKCHLPVKAVRTSVRNLTAAKFLTRLSFKRYSLFTLPNYAFYQDFRAYEGWSGAGKSGQDFGQDFGQDLTRTQEPIKAVETAILPKWQARAGKTLGKTLGNQQQQEKNKNKKGRNERSGASGDPRLDLPIRRQSRLLLLSLGMKKAIAFELSQDSSFRQVFNAVQYAKGKRNPAGIARRAIEEKWTIPDVLDEEQAFEALRAHEENVSSERPNAARRPTSPRREGESVDEWMRRITREKRERLGLSGSA